MSNLKPIVKWSGGKKDEIKKFIEHIPTDFNTYLEKVNLTGTIMSRANFTAIHYSNKSRPIQLSNIEIDSAKADGVNFNGMHFENVEDKNNELMKSYLSFPLYQEFFLIVL